MTIDTSHIQACRKAWHEHYDKCPRCNDSGGFLDRFKSCEQGAVLYGEYKSAISAHPDLESVVVESV